MRNAGSFKFDKSDHYTDSRITAMMIQDVRDTLHIALACQNTIEIPQTLREIRNELRKLNVKRCPLAKKGKKR